MKVHFPLPTPRSPAAAFTLLEILVVVVIISLLLAIMTPPLISVMEGTRLTQSGQSLLFRISMAKQLSLAENRPVELRLFHYPDEDGHEGYHASQIYFYDETANERDPIESPFYFSKGVMIPDSPLSPLLTRTGKEAPTAKREPFKSLNATYQSIIFYPNGSTSIQQPLRDAYLTLCYTRSNSSNPSAAPPNYYTIQIDPVNGTAKSYRPN